MDFFTTLVLQINMSLFSSLKKHHKLFEHFVFIQTSSLKMQSFFLFVSMHQLPVSFLIISLLCMNIGVFCAVCVHSCRVICPCWITSKVAKQQ